MARWAARCSLWCGVAPSVRRKPCEKCPTDRPHSRASSLGDTPPRLARRISFERRSCLARAHPDRPRHWPHAFIVRAMHPDREHDVVEKQPVSLVRIAEGRQHQAPEAGNRDGVDARSRLTVQVANARRVGVVGDRVQRRTQQIESQSVRTPGSRFRSRRGLSHRRSSAINQLFPIGNIGGAKRREKHLPAESNRSFQTADDHTVAP